MPLLTSFSRIIAAISIVELNFIGFFMNLFYFINKKFKKQLYLVQGNEL